MKAVMVMYDSLDKHFLQPYGCNWTHTPNFCRLTQRATRFDKFFVGSMPCMPARRELHTGRYNFLHRGWGPLEPFDDSMPEILTKNGVYTHLSTDHYHYWQDGGATYHNRYSSAELIRGQEGDAWKAEVADPDDSFLHDTYAQRKQFQGQSLRNDLVNRKYIHSDQEMPQSLTFTNGLQFIETNHDQDNWFLSIETFDPHEPFFTQEDYKKLYPHEYHGKFFDWPNYTAVTEGEEALNHVRMEYAALVSMCDAKLGLVLDAFDKYDLWKDTMLIVNTDHGFLLGEHDWWGKQGPLFNEVANTPFFIYDPRCSNMPKTCDALAQTIDIAPTLLEFFGQKIPKDMMGVPLKNAYQHGKKLRQYALYGHHGGMTCITDGRYTYMRAPVTKDETYEYTVMPCDMNRMFSPEDLQSMQICEPFSFTKKAKVMKIKRVSGYKKVCAPYDLLFDLQKDPGQLNNLKDWEKRAELCNAMIKEFKANDAPTDLYVRMGFSGKRKVAAKNLSNQENKRTAFMEKGIYVQLPFTTGAAEYFHSILEMVPAIARPAVSVPFVSFCKKQGGTVTIAMVNNFLETLKNSPMKALAFGAKMLMGFYLPFEKEQASL
ncbi:MAG: sulfatase [Faecousia sp.]